MAARLPRIVVGSMFALLTCAGSSAWGQALGVQQVLERLAVFNSGAVLEMSVDGSGLTSPDFSDYGVTAATGFTACQLHPTRGLYCLDGREVRRWQDPTLGGIGPVEFSCANPSLPLDIARADVCSTMTVAPDGSVWISGRQRHHVQADQARAPARGRLLPRGRGHCRLRRRAVGVLLP